MKQIFLFEDLTLDKVGTSPTTIGGIMHNLFASSHTDEVSLFKAVI